MGKRNNPENDKTSEATEPTNGSDSNAPVTGRNWQIAKLAATLLKGKEIEAASSPTWTWADEYFHDRAENAIRQSRTLLQLAEAPILQKTSLYQWFDPGEVYSVSEVSTKITELEGWKLAKNEGTVREKLIKSINEGWTARIEAMKADPQVALGDALSIREQLRTALQPILDNPESRRHLPKIEDATSRFLHELIDDRTLFTDEEMTTIKCERDEELRDWCFCEDLSDKSMMKVRAHELFRFAEEKNIINDKWRPIELRHLAEKFRAEHPGRVISVRRSFAAFNERNNNSTLFSYPWSS